MLESIAQTHESNNQRKLVRKLYGSLGTAATVSILCIRDCQDVLQYTICYGCFGPYHLLLWEGSIDPSSCRENLGWQIVSDDGTAAR